MSICTTKVSITVDISLVLPLPQNLHNALIKFSQSNLPLEYYYTKIIKSRVSIQTKMCFENNGKSSLTALKYLVLTFSA